MQRLEVSGAVRPIYGSLGVKRLRRKGNMVHTKTRTAQSALSISVLKQQICIDTRRCLF